MNFSTVKRTIKKRNFVNGRIYLEMVKFVYMIGKALLPLLAKLNRRWKENQDIPSHSEAL